MDNLDLNQPVLHYKGYYPEEGRDIAETMTLKEAVDMSYNAVCRLRFHLGNRTRTLTEIHKADYGICATMIRIHNLLTIRYNNGERLAPFEQIDEYLVNLGMIVAADWYLFSIAIDEESYLKSLEGLTQSLTHYHRREGLNS